MLDRRAGHGHRLRLSFPYFLRRSAPVSGASGLTGYECDLAASPRGGNVRLVITMPLSALAPLQPEAS